MKREENFEKLVDGFRSWNVSDPEAWAESQRTEGIPQYERLVFLRGAWQTIIDEGDTSWIEPVMEQSTRRPDSPGASGGCALKRLLSVGADPRDIAEIVRVMQWQVLHGIVYMLADPSVVAYPTNDVPRVNWRLYAVDEHGQPTHEIGSLHESVLETEPSGREMRPVSGS